MCEYVLKIACKDAKGLIYKISKIIYQKDINVIKNDEFVGNEHFFFRAILKGRLDTKALEEEIKTTLQRKAYVSCKQRKEKNIVIFATKEAHVLGDLLIAHFSKALKANIKAVISNHEILRPLVERFDIPYFFISAEQKTRQEHEKEVLKVLDTLDFELLVLAKYMRILSTDFTQAFKNKIINIHHSFLPAFIGANPYKQAFLRGVKIIGATAHFVNDNLDEGPIITQDILHINHSFSVEELRAAGALVEKNVLAKALKLVLDDKIFIKNNKTIIF